MDTLTITLKQAILHVLQDYRDFLGKDPDTHLQLILDETNNHYLLIDIGLQDQRRILSYICGREANILADIVKAMGCPGPKLRGFYTDYDRAT